MTEPGPNDRPQDAGRRHRRVGRPSAATLTLLEEYQAAMREELRATLVEVRGQPVAPGLLDDVMAGGGVTVVRPTLADRTRLWDLAIKLGRELGAEVDVGPPAPPVRARPAGGPKRGRVDYGGA